MSAETVLSHPSYSYLAGLLNNVKGEFTDMTLAPGVSVHRCLLGKLSPLLTSLPTFMDSSEVLTVVLPQVEDTTVEKMAELIYSGRCILAQSEIPKLEHLLSILDLSSVIQLGYEDVGGSESLSAKEEEVMDNDMGEVLCAEQEDGLLAQSERSSVVEIWPFVFSKQEQTRNRENVKRLVERNRRSNFGLNNKIDVITFGDKSCKICGQSFVIGRGSKSGKVSRYQIAHHMFSQHYGAEILNMLGVKQSKCEICGGKFGHRYNLARHIGEVHEEATKMYLQDTGTKLTVDANTNHKFDGYLTERNLKRGSRQMDFDLSSKRFGFSKKIRPRRVVRGLKCREVMSRKRVVVEVINVAPIVQDNFMSNADNVGSADGMARRSMASTSPVRLQDPLPAHLSSRHLVHGVNNLAWRVEGDEEYSECVMDWVKTRQARNIMEFCDLTVGESDFFCLWNQFMLERGFVGSVGRGHMARLVDMFVEELGRKVMEDRLYRQFVMHLGQLEREAVLSKEELLRLVIKIQHLK